MLYIQQEDDYETILVAAALVESSATKFPTPPVDWQEVTWKLNQGAHSLMVLAFGRKSTLNSHFARCA
jgi:hypothetical protein